MAVEVRVPTLGESVTEATVASWFKQPGDAVAADEMLCELETDKVTVEVPSPASGRMGEHVAKAGETVGVDALLATIEEEAGAATDSATEPAKSERGPSEPRAIARPEGDNGSDAREAEAPSEETRPARADVEDAPSAKKAMAEKGLRADDVQGTGRDGRVMKEDVARAAAGQPAETRGEPRPVPSVQEQPGFGGQPAARSAPHPADEGAREKRVRMTRLRQTIARRLKEAQNTAAMLTTYNEVDLGQVMAIRNDFKEDFQKKHGVKLGFMSFFVKACCHALREVPSVNAEIVGDEVVYKEYAHIGVAVGTPQGLVVPVVRDADGMGFAEIEKTIAALGEKARDGKLSMADMQGGTFTISNGGVYGSLMSAPILNPPQSGILGMHKIQERPVAVGGEIAVRPMMYLALSYDHRVVDGKEAVTFLVRVKESLEDPERLVLDL
ncbi:MAG TPA: 2-oxoglutarate dehydrogenase complex dihydrolipoyllysine-residue succinyltransferase [Paracoccaceae bacterium]|nr:2-oxoglutarate dehydrogenase complex dihydrolipoyllysine-residue succinyltransferase [Paracoccaceae bacterium]